MTEEEARKKWCPQVRFVANNPEVAYIGNRFDANTEDAHCKCLASDCMMWRWGDNGSKSLGQQQAEGLGLFENNGGYCGLAR